MAKYLDENGVSYLWNKMTNYVDQQGTSGSSNPLKYYSQEFVSNGTFTVPENVYTIFVTACGGGGGGGGTHKYTKNYDRYYNGSGGGGAEAIVRKPFSVTPLTQMFITVGKGGNGGVYSNYNSDESTSYGADGTSTVIGSLITLLGGQGGRVGDTLSFLPARNGGGYGGLSSSKGEEVETIPATQNGGDGILGKGGIALTPVFNIESTSSAGSIYSYGGGGGGGSLGNGGNGASYDIPATNGTRGGGGGGAFYDSGHHASGKGGDGYVLIEWWVN